MAVVVPGSSRMMNRHRQWSSVSVIVPVGGYTFVPRLEIIFSSSRVPSASSVSEAPSSSAESGDSTNTSRPTTLRSVAFT